VGIENAGGAGFTFLIRLGNSSAEIKADLYLIHQHISTLAHQHITLFASSNMKKPG
jgi:hypothetical protein